MRRAIERDHARVVVHLDEDRHVTRALQDPAVVVVRLGQHWHGRAEQDAPPGEAAIVRTIRRTDRFVLLPRVYLLLRLGRERRYAPIRRIDDERGATALHAALAACEEGVGLRAGLAGAQRAIGIGGLDALLLPCDRFLS